jgi:hypothetical protein
VDPTANAETRVHRAVGLPPHHQRPSNRRPSEVDERWTTEAGFRSFGRDRQSSCKGSCNELQDTTAPCEAMSRANVTGRQ